MDNTSKVDNIEPSFQDAVVFKFTNIVCESYNQSWFVFHNYRLKAVGRNKVLLNVNGTILHPVNNASIRGRIFKKANGYKPWLFDIYFDACQYFLKRNQPVVNIVYRLFKEFTSLNHSCPYVGPQFVKDLYLRHELLGIPMPTGDYLLAIQWYFDKKLQFDTNVSFTFVEDLMKRN
ncbi:uncharacterized protein LOC113567447 [Drosophila persimilis]|uniref:uncharacterized protein LOC113564924 n=1 Tax=Drosophila persimilis TaxID=7234 RepID=UPI000F07E4C3|nr:uncharacterized protein LOC113564924 [Drosophila persimilis]XP_026851145.1 uncharacterized protein LOC113567447 [Drosophila persimilis]